MSHPPASPLAEEFVHVLDAAGNEISYGKARVQTAEPTVLYFPFAMDSLTSLEEQSTCLIRPDGERIAVCQGSLCQGCTGGLMHHVHFQRTGPATLN